MLFWVMFMRKQNWKTYVLWILLAEVVGLFAGWLTRDASLNFGETVVQPPLSPPAILFPIVWTILYALMGFGAARVSLAEPSKERSRALNLFSVQLIVNFFWTLLFFNAQAYGFAFFWLLLLWLLVGAMALAFGKITPLAGWLQLPYFLWVTFAAYLNWSIWQLNR